MSVNEELAERSVSLRHNLALAEDDIIGEAFDEARGVVSDAPPPQSVAQAQRLVRSAIRTARQTLIRRYIEFALQRWRQHAIMFQKITGVELAEQKRPDDVIVRRFTSQEARKLIDEVIRFSRGKNIFERIERSAAMRARELFEESLSKGWTPQKLQRELVQQMGFSRSRAETVVRTELKRIEQRVAEKRRERNRDLLSGVQYSAALDSLTCLICASVDGNVYYFDPVPKGARSEADKPAIPQHPRCRCEYIDVVKPWHELGFRIPKSQRRRFDGRPAKRMRYADWFARQPEDVQRAILGPGRFELFKRGRSVRSFARGGKVVPIEKLLEEEAEVAKPVRVARRRSTRPASDVASRQAATNGYADVSDRPNLLSGSPGAQAHFVTEEEARNAAKLVKAQTGGRGTVTVGRVVRHARGPDGQTHVGSAWRVTYISDEPTLIESAFDALRSMAGSPFPDLRARGIVVEGYVLGTMTVTQALGGEVTSQRRRPGGDVFFSPDALPKLPLRSRKITPEQAKTLARWLPAGATPIRIYGRLLIYRTARGTEITRIMP